MANGSLASGSALDLLESEDLELRRLFTQLRLKRGPSVEERAEYGDLAKQTIRRLATREAALVEVARVAADPDLREITDRLEVEMHDHRPSIDRIEKMSRGVQGINLRVGQDFEGAMVDLMQIVGTEIEWELSEGVPALEGALRRTDRGGELHSAGRVAQHAPTTLDPEGPRWWERAPVISRLLTLYDHLRDFPRKVARGR
jgi:hypothetical protein